MADVGPSNYHHRSAHSFNSILSGAVGVGGPQIEMMPNPQFSFPMLPPPSSSRGGMRVTSNDGSRPMSMHLNAPGSQAVPIAHRRAKSTALLPTFAFNAVDATGRHDIKTPPLLQEENSALTPSRYSGHRRGTSELVGGDAVHGAISSSPTKTGMFQFPATSPSLSVGPGRSMHKHRRSAASGDVRFMQQPSKGGPSTTSSMPTTPMERSTAYFAASGLDTPDLSDPFGPPSDDSEVNRPASRRMVGFADKVDYIPRPLSTISSGTESSMSNSQGHHTVNNSISSVMELRSPSPPSARSPHVSLGTMFENDVQTQDRTSSESRKRVEREGEWLRTASPSPEIPQPLPARVVFPMPATSQGVQSTQHKRPSLTYALGLDRRRSEPVILTQAATQARLSAISLQDDSAVASQRSVGEGKRLLESKSSRRSLKEWAASKIGMRTKEARRSTSNSSMSTIDRPCSAGEVSIPTKVVFDAPATAETDLDAVFDNQINDSERSCIGTPSQSMATPTPSFAGSFQSRDIDDSSPILDLDAALGPFKTPVFPGQKQRRELHSSRLAKDFTGSGMNYHRRTESAPELPPSGFPRGSMTTVSALPDVFEGEGEEDVDHSQSMRTVSSGSTQDEEPGVGIQVVDADNISPGTAFNWGAHDGLGIYRSTWEPERPTTSHGLTPRHSASNMGHKRSTSIMEETITEELNPMEQLVVVEDYEEPRTSSLTKSSNSSETPTLLAQQMDATSPSDHTQPLMTPDTYQTSNFSSPDCGRRQGSFDTSRLGTSASSLADNRTMSSCADQAHEVRSSTDDVPSLTSSRSTMMSNIHANASKRDFSNTSSDCTPSEGSGQFDPVVAVERRSKRASIASLSQLVGNSFTGKSKATTEASRPHTAVEPALTRVPKKEHRLKKLMFWRTKSKQSIHSTT